jgi:transcription termination factor Rho
MREMKLQDLKSKSPVELLGFAEEHSVENASTMRKQELMFAILKQLATKDIDIIGEGVVEVLQDGFGFLRAPEANYLPGPDDIRRRRSAGSDYGPATRSRAKFEVRKKASAILHF